MANGVGHSKSRNGKWEMRNGNEEIRKWNGNAQVVSCICKRRVLVVCDGFS